MAFSFKDRGFNKAKKNKEKNDKLVLSLRNTINEQNIEKSEVSVGSQAARRNRQDVIAFMKAWFNT